MLHLLSNEPRDYAWGSTTLLAALEGREPTGAPEAEVWFGDHHADPADVAEGSTLDALTDGQLPYLLKLLAAARPLSIQVHPTKAQAEQGFARERGLDASDPSRNYRDDNHKPELIVALSETFEGLCGLRPLEDSRLLLEGLGGAGAAAILSRMQGSDPLRDVLAWLLSGEAVSAVADLVDAVRREVASPSASLSEFAGDLSAVARIAQESPGDPGVAVALLMNRVVLRRGESVFLRAGLLHAYLSGLGVEIMAASDNVLRGGLTPKHIDVAELLSIADTTPGVVAPVLAERRGAGVEEYPVPVPDFALYRVTPGTRPVRVETGGAAIVLSTGGEVRVRADDGQVCEIPVGMAVFAGAGQDAVTIEGDGEAFLARPGHG